MLKAIIAIRILQMKTKTQPFTPPLLFYKERDDSSFSPQKILD